MNRWLSTLTLLLIVTTLYGHDEDSFGGDVISPSGDSLRLRRIVELTSDGVIQRDLYNDKVKARELFEEALKIDPSSVAANYQMSILLKEDEPKHSIVYAAEAMRGDSTNVWNLELYGENLITRGNYLAAKEIYEKLIQYRPSEPNYYRILAILHQFTDRPFSAIIVLDSAELKIGKNPHLGRIKQELLLSTSQEQRAEREALEMVANTPYDIQARLSLAEVYVAMQRDSLAEAEYKFALSIDPSSQDVLMSMCEFYEKRGITSSYFEALKLLFKNEEFNIEQSLSLLRRMMGKREFYRDNYVGITELISTLTLRYPDDKRVVDMRANHLISFGMLEEALDIYKSHTLEENPHLEYFQSIIEIESYNKRADSVELYVNRAIKLFPDNVELYITKANTKAFALEHEAAIEAYKEAMKRSESDTLSSAIWGYIGDIEYQISLTQDKESGQKRAMKRCYDAYDRALKLHGDNVLVLNNYAYFISEEAAGDFERALNMSSRAIELDKNNPTYLDTHAWLLYRLERYDEAAKYMRTAISLDKSKSPELPLHYGDILAAQGQDFMAEVYWKRAEGLGYPAEEILKRIESLKKGEQ